LLDDGRLTDSKGRTVNFSNTIIIMTSNIGSDKILTELQKDTPSKDDLHHELMKQLQSHFRPEFINRIDDVIIFDPISHEALDHIVTLQLDRLAAMLQQDKQISMTVTDAAKTLLADQGYDPAFGARPLRRTIQNLLLDELAMQLLDGTIAPGDTIEIDAQDGDITIHKS
jgi:ATP-dependent Clp protease ATP-binding subunit ClpA